MSRGPGAARKCSAQREAIGPVRHHAIVQLRAGRIVRPPFAAPHAPRFDAVPQMPCGGVPIADIPTSTAGTAIGWRAVTWRSRCGCMCPADSSPKIIPCGSGFRCRLCGRRFSSTHSREGCRQSKFPPRYLMHFRTDQPAEGVGRSGRGPEPGLAVCTRSADGLGRSRSPRPVRRVPPAMGRSHATASPGAVPLAKPQLYALVRQAIATVAPSRFDNLPNTVLESVQLGTPVIGSNGASIDEIIESGVQGELVPVGDVEGLARALIRAWRGAGPFDDRRIPLPRHLRRNAPGGRGRGLSGTGRPQPGDSFSQGGLMPTISVITPCYNYAHYLGATLDCLLRQTYADWECVVINDGSTDASGEVALQYAARDGRIRYVRRRTGGFRPRAIPVWTCARGKYVFCLDADDLIHDEALAWMAAAMDDRSQRVCLMQARNFVNDPAVDGFPFEARPRAENFLPNILADNFGPASLLPRRGAMVLAAGGFDAELRACEDWDLWIRLALLGAELKNVDRIGAYYRRHPTSMSAGKFRMWDAALRVRWKAYQRHHYRDRRVPTRVP